VCVLCLCVCAHREGDDVVWVVGLDEARVEEELTGWAGAVKYADLLARGQGRDLWVVGGGRGWVVGGGGCGYVDVWVCGCVDVWVWVGVGGCVCIDRCV
jgi:hypothetical protein